MKILKWFFGITFLIAGLGSLTNSLIIAIPAIVIGFILTPPLLKYIEDKSGNEISNMVKWVIGIISFFILSQGITKQKQDEDKKYDEIVEQASNLIDNKKIDEAIILIKKVKEKYNNTKENKAILLEKEIENSKSIEFAKQQLASMTEGEYKDLLNGELTKKILSQKTLNDNLIEILKSQAPNRDKIRAEIAEQKKIEKEQKEYERKIAHQKEIREKREEKIKQQINPWDGSHIKLTQYIKEHMNDPESYEHIETRYRDQIKSIIIVTKFRGKNAFGGKVINAIRAEVDIDGNIIKIISQN